MIPRKPSILFAFANTLHCTACTPFSASQSSTSSARGTRSPQCRRNRSVTIAGDARDTNEHPERPQEPEHQWPDAPKGQSCPTPYQIFDMKHDGKYTKSLYYKMVKLYHPDLSNNGNGSAGPNAGLSHAAKVERYHLIVAAHTILSDPIKRSAYDRFGAGWNGKAEVGDKSTWSKPSPFHEAGPFSQSWMDPSDPVWQNATWEDWERWRQSKEGAKQKPAPVYMANSYFLACVVALAIIGSSLNVTRAQEAGAYIVESRDLVHDRAAKELRRVKQEVKGLSNRQDRIDFFVRQREATMGLGDNQALREERANRLLKDKEICSSEEVKERGT